MRAFCQRLISQCYFEADPLIPRCPIVNTISDPAAIELLTAKLNFSVTVPFDSIAYTFNIVLRGGDATPMEGS